MTNYNSDFSSQPRYYDRYYRLNSVPEALFLIEAECFDTATDTTTNNRSSQKGIIFGWGLLATLLIVSGFQVVRSEDVTPANSPITTSEAGIAIDY